MHLQPPMLRPALHDTTNPIALLSDSHSYTSLLLALAAPPRVVFRIIRGLADEQLVSYHFEPLCSSSSPLGRFFQKCPLILSLPDLLILFIYSLCLARVVADGFKFPGGVFWAVTLELHRSRTGKKERAGVRRLLTFLLVRSTTAAAELIESDQ